MLSSDDVISLFFLTKSATRADCDKFATSTFGGPVTAVQPQGRFSYTVSARNDTMIIQFREQDSPLRLTAVTALLYRAHGELVAPFSRVGTLGGQQGGLDVYKMNKLPGVNYSHMVESLPSDDGTMMNFVDSLARYVRRDAVSPAGQLRLPFPPFFSDAGVMMMSEPADELTLATASLLMPGREVEPIV